MISEMKLEHFVGLGCLVAFGIWLLNNPKCDTGCRKVAGHMVAQGITGIVTGIVAT